MEELKKKYGLFTAIAMVVGIVIGSGVFFKAEKILIETGGDLATGIFAWFLGGLIMVICAYNFAIMATKYQKVNGVVDYAEATVGSKYGYFIGWFMAVVYTPALTSVLAWVSARYTIVLIGNEDWSIVGPEAIAISMIYLVGSYALNALSPVLAGKFQVTTTVIKLVPLFLMAIFGTIMGMQNGILYENFTAVTTSVGGNPLFGAVVATAFAYEGWIIATSINSELKDAKKNLPRALLFGTLLIMITYILYYIGLAGAVENSIIMASGEQGARLAFEAIFSKVAGTGLFVFVVISCLGTLNGLMLGCTRGFYSLAKRNQGPYPEMTKQVDPITNMPTNSAILGLLVAAIWLLFFYGSQLVAIPWFGPFSFDSSELPIITLYALYIPIFIMMMKKEKDLGVIKGKIVPILGICGALFMIVAAFVAHGEKVYYYLILFVVVQAVGLCFYKKR